MSRRCLLHIVRIFPPSPIFPCTDIYVNLPRQMPGQKDIPMDKIYILPCNCMFLAGTRCLTGKKSMKTRDCKKMFFSAPSFLRLFS